MVGTSEPVQPQETTETRATSTAKEKNRDIDILHFEKEGSVPDWVPGYASEIYPLLPGQSSKTLLALRKMQLKEKRSNGNSADHAYVALRTKVEVVTLPRGSSSRAARLLVIGTGYVSFCVRNTHFPQ